MKFAIAVLAAGVLMAGSVLGQTTGVNAGRRNPATQHQPGTPSSDSPAAQEAPTSAGAKIDPAKEAAIRRLMDITQTSKLGDNIADAITTQVRAVMGRTIQQPDRLQKFMDTFNQKFTASAPPSAVTDAAVPIYAQAFSMEDIDGLIKFYESPLGQRVVKVLPQVAQETERAGLQLDQKAAMNVLRGMSDEYPELKPMLPQEPGAGPAPAPAQPKP